MHSRWNEVKEGDFRVGRLCACGHDIDYHTFRPPRTTSSPKGYVAGGNCYVRYMSDGNPLCSCKGFRKMNNLDLVKYLNDTQALD